MRRDRRRRAGFGQFRTFDVRITIVDKSLANRKRAALVSTFGRVDLGLSTSF
jgi:hypothetical protein